MRFSFPWIAVILLLFVLFLNLLAVKGKSSYYHGLVSRLKLPRSYMPTWFWFNISLLLFSSAMPYLVRPNTSGEDCGVAMMLALDVSGSMGYIEHNNESRFDIARKSAISFIKKRVHDHIGLVLFGKFALTRCPLTYDKEFLVKTIKSYNLGEINPNGTVLFQALLAAINRLKESDAKSKVIILMTDGFPDGDGVPLEQVISLANKFDIRIYTIGVGLCARSLPAIYQQTCEAAQKLLEYIAKNAGGMFFNAEEAKQLEEIYSLIDALETSRNSYEMPIKKLTIDWVVAGVCLVSEFLRRFAYCLGVCL